MSENVKQVLINAYQTMDKHWQDKVMQEFPDCIEDISNYEEFLK